MSSPRSSSPQFMANGTEVLLSESTLEVPFVGENIARAVKRYLAVLNGIDTQNVCLADIADSNTENISFIVPNTFEPVRTLDIAESMDALAIMRLLASLDLRVNDLAVLSPRKKKSPIIIVPSISNVDEADAKLAEQNEDLLARLVILQLLPSETGFREMPGKRITTLTPLKGIYAVPSSLSIDGEVYAKQVDKADIKDGEHWFIDADLESLENVPVTIIPAPRGLDSVADYCEQLMVHSPLRSLPLYCHFGLTDPESLTNSYYMVLSVVYKNNNNIMARFLKDGTYSDYVNEFNVPVLIPL